MERISNTIVFMEKQFVLDHPKKDGQQADVRKVIFDYLSRK